MGKKKSKSRVFMEHGLLETLKKDMKGMNSLVWDAIDERCKEDKAKKAELQEVWLGYSVQIEKTYRKFVNIVGTVIDRFGVVLDDAMEVAKEVDA